MSEPTTALEAWCLAYRGEGTPVGELGRLYVGDLVDLSRLWIAELVRDVEVLFEFARIMVELVPEEDDMPEDPFVAWLKRQALAGRNDATASLGVMLRDGSDPLSIVADDQLRPAWRRARAEYDEQAKPAKPARSPRSGWPRRRGDGGVRTTVRRDPGE